MLSKTTLLFAVVSSAALFSTTASAKIERTVEKEFSVQSGAKLAVTTSGGKVRVESGDVQSVRIVARQIFPKANTDAEADDIAKSLDFSMEQSGNTVTASAKYTKATWGRTPVIVEFDVTVPRTCDATLSTSGGDVSVSDLTGAVKVRTSGGNISLGQINGSVNANTSGGDVKLAGCSQGAVLETSGGNVEAGPVAGDLSIKTSGGDIAINGAAGAVNAHTSGGSIKASLAQIENECQLSTTGGEVKLKLDKTSALLLDASTNGGRVWTADNLQIATIAGGYGKERFAGRINGGGPLVKLRTSGGNIDVRTN